MNDDTPDALAEQREQLARVILQAQRWTLWAHRLFLLGALMSVAGACLIAAGAWGAFACS